MSLTQIYQKRLPIWVITASPSDFPGRFVARLHYTIPTHQPTTMVIVDTLIGLRCRFRGMGLVCVDRDPMDDPVIVESWI